jgi:DNA repair exonuclease SbcCD ATPase subunit
MSSDLYPVELTIENLYCFRGKHTIQLGCFVYAVLAEAEDNPHRSNWLGKSTFLMAFALVMFGWHTKRTDDEIVTHGEDYARVSMKLNDGTVITRTKTLGKSMLVEFKAKGKKAITQARAQERIEQLIGFSKDDFFATYFYEQKKIGALVTAKAAERSAMVEGWLAEELEPVQRLHGAAVRVQKAATDALTALENEHEELLNDWIQLVTDRVTNGAGQEPSAVDVIAHLKAQVASHVMAKTNAKEALDQARKEQTDAEHELATWNEKVEKAADYDDIVERGLAAKAELDALPADAAEKRKEAEVACGRAITDADEAKERLRVLLSADYTFDGKCPIACQECPSAQWVRAQATGKEALAEAQEQAERLEKIRKAKHSAAREAITTATKRAALEAELVQLRARAEQLVDIAAEVEEREGVVIDEEALAATVAQKEQELEGATLRLSQLEEDLSWAEKAVRRMAELGVELAEAKERATVAGEAVAITGRNGAQQAIQEVVMAKVERRANALLGDAGIPLQVKVSWATETKGLAKVCDKCGTAFPTSQRVKQCTACGAARGPNMQRKLSIEPSNRSGAADDLAGIAIGIATSQWLRVQRGSRWASVFIDEPFGSLDRHNRAALGSHVAAMLRSAFASAFVVAHEQAIQSAMPATVRIVAGQDGSRIAA